MNPSSLVFSILSVAIPVLITEMLLCLCWRIWGDRGAYPWYSCLLRTAVYSPCFLLGGQGFTPLPLGTAFFFNLRGSGGEIVWLYGLPEIFVGVVCFLISFGIRLISAPAR